MDDAVVVITTGVGELTKTAKLVVENVSIVMLGTVTIGNVVVGSIG